MYIYYLRHNKNGGEMGVARKLADRDTKSKLAHVDTKDLQTEVDRRWAIDLARDRPHVFSNRVQLAIGSGLNSRDADEVSRLAKEGKPEEAVEKLLKARFRQIKPSTV